MDLGIGDPVASPLKPAADVNTNDHSEAMFHQLDDFKALMGVERMGSLYQKWVAHQCSDPVRREQWRGQPVWGEGWQEREADDRGGLWQLKIINFGFIWDAKGRQSNLAASGNALKTAADQVVQRLQAAWTSNAGDAAAERFTDLGKAAGDYATQVQRLGTELDGAWQATRHVVKELAEFATSGELSGKPMMDRYGAEGAGDDHGNSERGNWSSRMDELNKAIQYGTWDLGPEAHEVAEDTWGVDLGWGVNQQTAESVRQPGQVYIEADGSNMWSNEICNWLDDMAHCYFLTIGNFRRKVEDALTTVSETWQKLSNGADHLTLDPFGKLALGSGQGTDDGKKNPTDTGGDRPGTGSTGTGTGSTPLPPVQPVDDSTSPSGVDPIVDPPPGLPQDQTQETVTIEDGDRKISVQSPDGEGHVKVTVDDGTGKPKTYDLDFSAGTGTDTQSADGRPQTLPGGPESLPVQDAPPAPSGVQEPADAVQQVQAGPGGKAVVHDGNLTITAERPPGTPDQIKITIDDGTGKPTTYLVDYSDPANPSAAQQSGQPTPAGRPIAEPYPAVDPLAPGQRPAQPMTFTDPATTGLPDPLHAGFTDPPSPDTRSAALPLSGFADPTTSDARGFAQSAGGLADSGSDFADSAGAGRHAEAVNGGSPDTGTSTQGGFTEPVPSEGQGFAQASGGGFTDPTSPSGFAEPVSGDVRRFGDATPAQQAGSLSTEGHGFDQPVSSSTAPQSAGFTEPLDGGFAETGFAEPANSAFADQETGFVQSDGDFADLQAGFPDTAADGFTEPNGSGFSLEPDGFTDPVPDPGVGGFQVASQPDAFDAAAAQAIDTDQTGAFEQGATAQASGFAAGPSIGDDLFRDWSTGMSDSDIGEYQSPETAPYDRSEQLWTEPEAEQPSVSTSAQSLGFDVDTGDDSGMDSVWSTQGDLFVDSPDPGDEEIAPAAGEAGLAAVPDNGQSQPQPSTATNAGGMGGGGMPMMGGMAGGGGGNSDQQRGPSAWSTAGDLFDDGPLSEAERISTVLGDNER